MKFFCFFFSLFSPPTGSYSSLITFMWGGANPYFKIKIGKEKSIKVQPKDLNGVLKLEFPKYFSRGSSVDLLTYAKLVRRISPKTLRDLVHTLVEEPVAESTSLEIDIVEATPVEYDSVGRIKNVFKLNTLAVHEELAKYNVVYNFPNLDAARARLAELNRASVPGQSATPSSPANSHRVVTPGKSHKLENSTLSPLPSPSKEDFTDGWNNFTLEEQELINLKTPRYKMALVDPTVTPSRPHLPKIPLPEFSGKRDEKVTDFIENYENYGDVNGYDDKLLIKVFKCCLRGEALKAFNNNKIEYAACDSWNDVKRKFIKCFTEETVGGDFSAFCRRVQLPNERALSYVRDKLELLRRSKVELPVKDQIGLLTEGLLPHINAFVQVMKPETLQDFEADVCTATRSSSKLSQAQPINTLEYGVNFENDPEFIQKIEFQRRNQFPRTSNYHNGDGTRFSGAPAVPSAQPNDLGNIKDRLATLENQMREVKSDMSKLESVNQELKSNIKDLGQEVNSKLDTLLSLKTGKEQGNKSKPMSLENVQCYLCRNFGHFRNDCPLENNWRQESPKSGPKN